jgi:hypothetical protein
MEHFVCLKERRTEMKQGRKKEKQERKKTIEKRLLANDLMFHKKI